MNIDPKVFGGLVSQMKGNVGVRADLKKMGYSDELIPDWVAAGAELPAKFPPKVADSSSLEKLAPRLSYGRVGQEKDFS